VFDKISKGGVGLVGILAFFLILLGQWLDLPFTDANATVVAQQIVGVLGFVMMIIGQLSRKDLVNGVFRKEKTPEKTPERVM